MFTQRLARSRSRSSDSFERARGRIYNCHERRIALAGFSSNDKECLMFCLGVKLDQIQALPFSHRRNELIEKLQAMNNFIDNGNMADGWSPPSNRVEMNSRFFTLRDEVHDYCLDPRHANTSEWPVLVGPGLLNGQQSRIERMTEHRFTGYAYRLN